MNNYQSRTLKSLARLVTWGASWIAATAVMRFGPQSLWDKASPLTMIAAGLDICVGIGLIIAHKNYIADLDELQQRVYLNALAITVGVVLIIGIPFSVMHLYGLISFDADISHMVGLMSLTFVVSHIYGSVRYR